MIQYCEYIFDSLVKYEKGNVTKDDFTSRFETSNPPNFIFTPQEMWCYFLKKKLRILIGGVHNSKYFR